MAKDPDARGRVRRGRIRAGAIVLLLITLQLLSLSSPIQEGAARLVDIVRLAAFCLLVLVLALRSTTAFSFFGRSPELDDELSRANRAAAAKTGYLAAMFGGVAALVASLFVSLSVLEILPLVLLLGAFAAAIRFARLEKRGEADG